jgi:ribosomal protein S18 acetylase RimI-like enzyme
MNRISIEQWGGDDKQLTRLIKSVGWNSRQLKGQLDAIHRLADNSNGVVLVANNGHNLLGYISAEFYEWNRLGQIQGLIVDPEYRRRRIGIRLVGEVEKFMRKKRARGIHVDTPVNNEIGRMFYTALGYTEDCIRSEFYDKNTDAVVYLNIFR